MRAVATLGAVAALASGCTMSKDTGPTTSAVATSAVVKVPTEPVERTAPGTQLKWGQSAYLPARTFAPTTGLAMYTITGINPASGIPDTITKNGTAYYVYITVTSLDEKPTAAPDITGVAGSPDGKSATLMVSPPSGNKDCVANTAPEKMKAGESYATCELAIVDADKKVTSVVYWANPTTDPTLNYEAAPVTWSSGVAPSTSVTPTR